MKVNWLLDGGQCQRREREGCDEHPVRVLSRIPKRRNGDTGSRLAYAPLCGPLSSLGRSRVRSPRAKPGCFRQPFLAHVAGLCIAWSNSQHTHLRVPEPQRFVRSIHRSLGDVRLGWGYLLRNGWQISKRQGTCGSKNGNLSSSSDMWLHSVRRFYQAGRLSIGDGLRLSSPTSGAWHYRHESSSESHLSERAGHRTRGRRLRTLLPFGRHCKNHDVKARRPAIHGSNSASRTGDGAVVKETNDRSAYRLA